MKIFSTKFGKATLSTVPRHIAKCLKIKDSERYIEYAYRWPSATKLIGSGEVVYSTLLKNKEDKDLPCMADT